MRNPEVDRLKNKLALWDTQGFSQFVADLALYKDDSSIQFHTETLKRLYKSRLDEITEEESKFKQGKLEL